MTSEPQLITNGPGRARPNDHGETQPPARARSDLGLRSNAAASRGAGQRSGAQTTEAFDEGICAITVVQRYQNGTWQDVCSRMARRPGSALTPPSPTLAL